MLLYRAAGVLTRGGWEKWKVGLRHLEMPVTIDAYSGWPDAAYSLMLSAGTQDLESACRPVTLLQSYF